MVVFGLFPVRGLPICFAICLPLYRGRLFPFFVPLDFLQDCIFQPPAQGLLLSHSSNTTLMDNIKVDSDTGVLFRSTTLCHIYIVIAVILKVKEVLD